MHIHNAHARKIPRPVEEVFNSLCGIGTSGDSLWPAPSMPFERTPGPLVVGFTRESHGIIRAVLDELDPGRRMVWRADQPFLKGTHGFEVRPTATGCEVEHVLDADLAWWFVPVWAFKVRAIHDRIVEGLLDRIEAAGAPGATGVGVGRYGEQARRIQPDIRTDRRAGYRAPS